SRNVALELRYLTRMVNAAPTATAALRAITAPATALQLDLQLPDPDPFAADTRIFYDLSGRIVIATLRAELPGLMGIDLGSDLKQVRLHLTTGHGPLRVDFPRSRVSASNPHQLLVLMGGVSLLLTVISFLFL